HRSQVQLAREVSSETGDRRVVVNLCPARHASLLKHVLGEYYQLGRRSVGEVRLDPGDHALKNLARRVLIAAVDGKPGAELEQSIIFEGEPRAAVRAAGEVADSKLH